MQRQLSLKSWSYFCCCKIASNIPHFFNIVFVLQIIFYYRNVELACFLKWYRIKINKWVDAFIIKTLLAPGTLFGIASVDSLE